jgi:hypothetical protein
MAKECWIRGLHHLMTVLYVTDTMVSKNGKRIPLNLKNNEPHRCVNRRFNIPCKNCKQPIYFSDYKISKSGKKIPLDAADGTPHECNNNSLSYNFGVKTMFG